MRWKMNSTYERLERLASLTDNNTMMRMIHYFPTCQVRVVRFYQSCSSPSPPSPPPPLHPLPGPLPPLPCPLPPCQLFAQLFANFCAQWALPDLYCRLPIWVGTAGPQPQGSERSEHRWTSTWDLPSSVSTAGPQPETVRAQWAPLDLNLGPSELSEHRWTSTWDPPSSVSTAGPQRPDRLPEDMPDRTPDRMSERMPEDMPDKVPECLPDRMPEDMRDRMPEGMPDRISDRMPEDMPDKVPECLPDRMPEDMPDRVPEDMPDRMPEDMSDRMPEDLPVTKRIDVMVGITRSKVFFCRLVKANIVLFPTCRTLDIVDCKKWQLLATWVDKYIQIFQFRAK